VHLIHTLDVLEALEFATDANYKFVNGNDDNDDDNDLITNPGCMLKRILFKIFFVIY
jgi:hypothetical protein